MLSKRALHFVDGREERTGEGASVVKCGLWMYWNACAAKVECEFSPGFIRPRCSAVACAISLILDYPAIRFTASIRESIWSIVFTPLEN
jgi:hypothetical protein